MAEPIMLYVLLSFMINLRKSA